MPSGELRDQIAEAIHRADCGCADQIGNGRDDDYYNDLTAAVVAVVEPKLSEAMAEAEQLREQLRLANIDAVTTAAELDEERQCAVSLRRELQATVRAKQRAERAEAERDTAVRLVNEILAHFTEPGHPGVPCHRTGWVPLMKIAAWRASIARPPAALNPAGGSDRPEPSGAVHELRQQWFGDDYWRKP